METQIATKKNSILIIIIILFYSVNINSQDNKNEYYRLYKNGELFKKEAVCVRINEDFKKTFNQGKTKYIFKDKMIFIKTNYKIKNNDIENLNSKKCVHPTDLFNIEKRNIENSMKVVMDKKGFKPIYPLKNITLKVFICDENNEFQRVHWVKRNF